MLSLKIKMINVVIICRWIRYHFHLKNDRLLQQLMFHITYLTLSSVSVAWSDNWCLASGCLGGIALAGEALFAVRTAIGFPLHMTYTAQNSGTSLVKIDGTSGFLNILQGGRTTASHKGFKFRELWHTREVMETGSDRDLLRAFLFEAPTTIFWM